MDFQKIIEITIQHQFTEGMFSKFNIEPTKDCKRLLHNSGLYYKKREGGLVILWDKTTEALSTLPGPEREGFKLTFYLDISDPYFFNYTNLDCSSLDGVFYFTNNKLKKGNKDNSLSSAEFVTTEDFFLIKGESFNWRIEDVSEVQLFELVHPNSDSVIDSFGSQVSQQNVPISLSAYQDGLYHLKKEGEVVSAFYKDAALSWKPRFGVIELFLFDENNGVAPVIDQKEEGTVSYNISFQARSTYWRYYIIPKHTVQVDETLLISNKRNGTTMNFINKGKKRLSDGSEATVFDSEKVIGLREVNTGKYQLKRPTGKPLIKLLPTPSVNFINANNDNGKQHFYSEMYVYL